MQDKLFQEEKITIISPLKSNSKIWNKEEFDVKIITMEEEKLVIIREKLTP